MSLLVPYGALAPIAKIAAKTAANIVWKNQKWTKKIRHSHQNELHNNFHISRIINQKFLLTTFAILLFYVLKEKMNFKLVWLEAQYDAQLIWNICLYTKP